VEEFIAPIDLLADHLTPARRPEDHAEPECSQTELRLLSVLAGSLGVHLSAAARAIDKLVAKGFVERNRIATDRRVVQVGLSAESVAGAWSRRERVAD
jgi:DNA-binding MarR family transcriptional regulator